MDRRVLYVSIVLAAGILTGVSVALFAIVGLDEGGTDLSIEWESPPAGVGDGSEAVVAVPDDETYLVQLAAVGEHDCGLRAVDATNGDVEWAHPLMGDCSDVTDLAAGTIDGDSVIAVGIPTDSGGELRVVDAETGSERGTAALDGVPIGEPAVDDVTGDGSAEIAVVDATGTVDVFDERLEHVWTNDVSGTVSHRPIVVDGGVAVVSDADGSNDATDDGGTTVSLLDEGGEPSWSETRDGTVYSWTAADTRNGPTLVFGTTDGVVMTLEADDGSDRYDVRLQDLPIEVGDADAGRIHVGGVGAVWAVDLLDGEVVWKQQYGGETRVNAPVAADVTGDGTANVVAVNREGDVIAFSRSNEVEARGDVETIVYGSPHVVDRVENRSGSDPGTATRVLVVDQDGRVLGLTDQPGQAGPV